MTDTCEQEQGIVMIAEPPSWLSYSAAQRFSGLGRTKLWELISSGDVEAAKVGRAVRINRQSLDEYMKRNRYVAVGR
jgi:excisionase family DNA binding protein